MIPKGRHHKIPAETPSMQAPTKDQYEKKPLKNIRHYSKRMRQIA